MSTMMEVPNQILSLSLLLLLTFLPIVLANVPVGSILESGQLGTIVSALLVVIFPKEIGISSVSRRKVVKAPPRIDARKRKRRLVHSIFEELGPYYVKRAYRMDEASFWKLHRMLASLMSPKKNANSKKKHKDGATNGLIVSSIRLSCAIRYFAGGRPEDISLVHGISHSEVFRSVWLVVDAVN